MAKIAQGRTFRQDISPAFYFAGGIKVAQMPAPRIYLWLIPRGTGAWTLLIGPKVDMKPDYIGVTTLPFSPPLVLNATIPTKGLKFCFTMEPRDYDAAVKQVRASGASGVVEILSAQCKANDEGVGHGMITTRTTGLSPGELEFEADLEIPVYTTDCPKP